MRKFGKFSLTMKFSCNMKSATSELSNTVPSGTYFYFTIGLHDLKFGVGPPSFIASMAIKLRSCSQIALVKAPRIYASTNGQFFEVHKLVVHVRLAKLSLVSMTGFFSRCFC